MHGYSKTRWAHVSMDQQDIGHPDGRVHTVTDTGTQTAFGAHTNGAQDEGHVHPSLLGAGTLLSTPYANPFNPHNAQQVNAILISQGRKQKPREVMFKVT